MASEHVPELVPMLIGTPGLALRASRWHIESVRLLARAVCEAYPDVFGDEDPHDPRWGTRAEQDAQHRFLHWGGGWFENDEFLLHGYRYDDVCECGAWDTDPPAAALTVSEPATVEDARAVLCVCADGECGYLRGDVFVPEPPGFVHKPTGVAMSWYKHVARSASISSDISDDHWDMVMAACKKSLDNTPTAMHTRQADWPVRAARRAAHAEYAAWASEHTDALQSAAAQRAADWASV